MKDRSRHGGAELGGMLWFIGWLFTIGFAQLTFWKGALAIFTWPFFLGRCLSPIGG